MAPVPWPRWKVLFATLILIVACQGDRSIGPVPEDTGLEPIGECSRSCTIASGAAPLAAARYLPDSTAWPVYLAEVLVSGGPGAELSLRLTAGEDLTKAFRNQGNLLVTIGNSRAITVPMAALSKRFRLFTFESEDTVRVRYYLARDMREYPKGGFELVQDVMDGAVVTSHRPFVRSSPALALIGPCPVGSNSFGVVCGVPFNISPWAAGGFGATFQSNPGSGESSLITVTFSRSVKSVTIQIYDPDFGGNSAAAFSVSGALLGQVGFTGDGTPGELTRETQTISAPRIRRVDLTPAAADYVAYDMSIVPDSICEPPWPDPWLHDPDVQNDMNSRWQTEWDKQFDRKEPGTWIVKDQATGEYEMVDAPFTYQDQCDIDFALPVPSFPGKEVVGWWHGHMLKEGQPAPLGCRNVAEGDVIESGISDRDQRFAKDSGKPGYALDEDEMFKVKADGSRDGSMPWTKQNFCRP